MFRCSNNHTSYTCQWGDVECSDGSDKIECCKFIYICGLESCFLSQLDKCHSWFELELTAFQHHAVNLCRWKIQSDPSCLLCHTRPCTVHHILNCFPTALNQKRYTWHHESILTHLSITFKHNFHRGPLYTLLTFQASEPLKTPLWLCLSHWFLQLLDQTWSSSKERMSKFWSLLSL